MDFSGKLPISAQEGMARADKNANPVWVHIFDACVLAAAKKKAEITSDDVLEEIEALPDPPSTHSLAAIGPAMVRASKTGIIRASDRLQRSKRPEKHGNLGRVWISLVYRGA